MTDPRYWIWLWSFEDEIRNKMPIVYYHVWDNLPIPKYNYDYYNSCDSILCISKISYQIATQCKKDTNGIFNVIDCPHGVDIETFKPLDWNEEFENIVAMRDWESAGKPEDKKPSLINLHYFKERIQESAKDWIQDYKNIEFIIFWSNKNMRRKNAPVVMEAFHKFAKDKKDCMLILHTEVCTDHGTDLHVVRDTLFNDVPIVLFPHRIPELELVKFYNISACTLNIASAEGFGLSSLESLACGIPVINNKI